MRVLIFSGGMSFGAEREAPGIAEPMAQSIWTKSDNYTFFMTAEELGLYLDSVRERCSRLEELASLRGYHRGRRGKALCPDD